MSDHTVSGMRAALKALKDVVSPAVDPSNPLAVEQLRMVCGFLAMVCEQLPYRAQRVRFDLLSAVDLAQALASGIDLATLDRAEALPVALASAIALQRTPDASEADLQQATALLAEAIRNLIRESAEVDEATRRKLERVVLRHSKTWLDVQRAWFSPLGFDKEARMLPPIAVALNASPSSVTQIERASS
jgi:hypothetical protein